MTTIMSTTTTEDRLSNNVRKRRHIKSSNHRHARSASRARDLCSSVRAPPRSQVTRCASPVGANVEALKADLSTFNYLTAADGPDDGEKRGKKSKKCRQSKKSQTFWRKLSWKHHWIRMVRWHANCGSAQMPWL